MYFLYLDSEFLRAKSEISPKTKVEENGNPYPQNFCFHFPSPFEISTLVERSNNFREKKIVERKISFHPDFARNKFELCLGYTAKLCKFLLII